jgi:hypothetical protein
VALKQDGIVVASDSLTGQTLATFAPPAHTAFAGVTAAADDRTFVVEAVTSSDGATLTASWFEVRLAPRHRAPGPPDLPDLPDPPAPPGVIVDHRAADTRRGHPAAGQVFTAALSGSGQELAVADIPAAPVSDAGSDRNRQEVKKSPRKCRRSILG